MPLTPAALRGAMRIAPAVVTAGLLVTACSAGSGAVSDGSSAGSAQNGQGSTAAATSSPASPAATPELAQAASGSLAVTQAWVRTPANPSVTAAYMVVRNTGSAPQVLDSASSPAAGAAELHTSKSTGNGAEKMVPAGPITVPPDGQVRFATGSYHVMLMQLQRQLQPGDRVPVTLGFDSGASVNVEMPVLARDQEPR